MTEPSSLPPRVHELPLSGRAIPVWQVAEVALESKLAVGEARRYLQRFSAVLIASEDGVAHEELDLVESVRARQLAALLLNKLEAYVHQMVDHGTLSGNEAEHLFHQARSPCPLNGHWPLPVRFDGPSL
jgi:hypothetical protein